MSITFTMFILWLASVPNITWPFILIGLLGDVGCHIVNRIIGLKGE